MLDWRIGLLSMEESPRFGPTKPVQQAVFLLVTARGAACICASSQSARLTILVAEPCRRRYGKESTITLDASGIG
jgi:hypothetical protein